jgi:hypothetical protein
MPAPPAAPPRHADIPIVEPAEEVPEVLPVTQPPAGAARKDQPARQGEVAGPRPDVLWWRGNCVDGLNMQPGGVVLRDDFLAFVPSGKSRNLVGVLAGGLAEAASPVQTIPLDWLRRRPDPLRLVEDLWAERPRRLDGHLPRRPRMRARRVAVSGPGRAMHASAGEGRGRCSSGS